MWSFIIAILPDEPIGATDKILTVSFFTLCWIPSSNICNKIVWNKLNWVLLAKFIVHQVHIHCCQSHMKQKSKPLSTPRFGIGAMYLSIIELGLVYVYVSILLTITSLIPTQSMNTHRYFKDYTLYHSLNIWQHAVTDWSIEMVVRILHNSSNPILLGHVPSEILMRMGQSQFVY